MDFHSLVCLCLLQLFFARHYILIIISQFCLLIFGSLRLQFKVPSEENLRWQLHKTSNLTKVTKITLFSSIGNSQFFSVKYQYRLTILHLTECSALPVPMWLDHIRYSFHFILLLPFILPKNHCYMQIFLRDMTIWLCKQSILTQNYISIARIEKITLSEIHNFCIYYRIYSIYYIFRKLYFSDPIEQDSWWKCSTKTIYFTA